MLFIIKLMKSELVSIKLNIFRIRPFYLITLDQTYIYYVNFQLNIGNLDLKQTSS